jgi:hypothetical protein
MTYYVIFREGVIADSIHTHVLTNREEADKIARMARDEAEEEGTKWGYLAVDSEILTLVGKNTDLNPVTRRNTRNLKGEL